MDPFSQQLVQLNQTIEFGHANRDSQATTLRAQNYTRGDMIVINETKSAENPEGPNMVIVGTAIDPSMHGAILSGLSQSAALIEQQMSATCPTGNCTFPSFNTLGVCQRCTDVTSRLEKVNGFGEVMSYLNELMDFKADPPFHDDDVTAYVLPNGHFLINVNGCPTRRQDLNGFCRYHGATTNSSHASYRAVQTLEMTAHSTPIPNATVSMQDLDTMIWSTSVIYIDEVQRDTLKSQWEDSGPHEEPSDQEWNYWPGNPITAKECALYYCVKSIETSIQGNILHEKSEQVRNAVRKPGSWTAPNRTMLEPFYAPENIPDHQRGLEYDPRYSAIAMTDLVIHDPQAPGEPEYALSYQSVYSISQILQRELQVDLFKNTGGLEMVKKAYPNASVLINGVKAASTLYPSTIGGLWDNSKENMTYRFMAVATSMTNDMRRTCNLANSNTTSNRITVQGHTDFDESNPPIWGMVGVAKVHYRIEWYWIVLHAVLVLFSIVFCGLTMFKSNLGFNVPAWKTHSLATLSQGPAVEKALSRAATTRDLEKIASKDSVQMHPDQKMLFNLAARDTAAGMDNISIRFEDGSSRTDRGGEVSPRHNG